MTFFHFINCVVLTYGPLVVTYRFSGLLESASIWSCLKVGVAYFLTQLLKMMLLATFYPQNEFDDETLIMEFVRCSVDLVDFLGLYLVITKLLGKGERKILVTAIGWASADAIATRFLPLWVGARGTEFDWKYIQSGFIANFNLVFIFSTCAFLWLWSRHDTSLNLLSLLGGLLAFLCYRQLILNHISQFFGSWTALGIQGLVAVAAGVTAMLLHP